MPRRKQNQKYLVNSAKSYTKILSSYTHLSICYSSGAARLKKDTIIHQYLYSMSWDSVELRLKTYVLVNRVTACKGWGIIKEGFADEMNQLKIFQVSKWWRRG